MVEQLNAAQCRREAERMRKKAAVEKDAVLREEYERVAECFDALADEIDRLKKHLNLSLD